MNTPFEELYSVHASQRQSDGINKVEFIGSYLDYHRAVNKAIQRDNLSPWEVITITDTMGDTVWCNQSDGE